jgi:flagellar assembly protein FliH
VKKSSPDSHPVVRLYEPLHFADKPDVLPEQGDQEGTAPESSPGLEERITAAEREGYEKGFNRGVEEGIRKGEEEGKDLLGRIEGILRELESFRETKTRELLPDLVDLALEVASGVIHREIDQDRNIVLHTAQEALKKLGDNEETIVIRLNPVDYDVMISNMEFLKELSGVKTITIEPANAISPGGCYIETPTGEIDARIGEQMKEMEDALRTAADSEV